MLKRSSLIVTCLATLFVTFGARADEWNKKTTITFSEPVELAGIVVPAGTCVFKLNHVPRTRQIHQVINAGENHVFATILAVPHLHLTPHEKAYIGVAERPGSLCLVVAGAIKALIREDG